jgi:hypothetical protein
MCKYFRRKTNLNAHFLSFIVCHFIFTASDIAEELMLTAEKALERISDWKAHILRTQNQEEGRYKALEELQEHQLLIVMDWAMKFLPALYREKQSDFFGQKGMSWHVSVAIFRAEDRSLKVRTSQIDVCCTSQ